MLKSTVPAALPSSFHFENGSGKAHVHYIVKGGGKNTDTSGYHETLTVLWLWVLAEFLDGLPEGGPRIDAVRKAVDRYSGNRLYSDYYSYDVSKSVEARKIWVEPDKRVLPEEGCPFEI